MFKISDITPDIIKFPNTGFITGNEVPIKAGQSMHDEILTKISPVIDKIKTNVFQGIMSGMDTGSRMLGAVAARGGIFKQDVPELKPKGTISESFANQPTLSEVVSKGVEKVPVVGKIPGVPAVAGMLAEGYFLPGGGKEKETESLLKGLGKDIAATTEKDNILGMLKSKLPDLAPQHADELASKLTKISDPNQVVEEIKNFKPSEIAPVVEPTTKELGHITSIKKSPIISPEFKQTVSDLESTFTQHDVRSTSELQGRIQKLVAEDIVKAEESFASAEGDEKVALGIELTKHYSALLDSATTESQKKLFKDKGAYYSVETAQNLLQAGRSVQAATILNRMDPENLTRYAARNIIRYNEALPKGSKKIAEFTGEQFSAITDAAKKIKAMPEGEEKGIATQKLFDEINKSVPSSLYQKLVSVWKAGLLTGLKTSGGNILSNTLHGAMEVAKDVPAFAVDKVASLFTGKQTIGLTPRGIISGVRDGFSKGFTYLKTGFDERNMAQKLDYKKVNFGESPIARGLQKYEETIFRVMGAEDQPFYYGAKARSLESQAIAEGRNQGLKGSALIKYANDLVQHPSDEMLNNAVKDAETAVFQNKTPLGEIAKALQKAKFEGKPIPGAEIVVPFSTTPAAIATQVWRYSPAGLVQKTIKAVVDIKHGEFNQREFVQAMGRGLTGSGILAVGSALMSKGIMTLSAPTNEKERNQWELEGKIPNAIKIGGEWKSVNYFGTAGNLMLIGGYYQQALENTGSPVKALEQAVAGAGKSLTDQTFLQGLSGALNAVNDPIRYAEQFTKSTVGSVIPTIVGDMAKATDQYNRDTKGGGVVETLKSRIPGARETLPVKRDVFGEATTPGISFLRIMADPTRPSPEKGDATVQELRRLADEGLNATPSSIKDKFSVSGIQIKLTQDQVQTLDEVVGKTTKTVFDKVIQGQEYQDATEEEKAKILTDVHAQVLDAVRERVVTQSQVKEGVQEKVKKIIKQQTGK